jgi:hypothetical protein
MTDPKPAGAAVDTERVIRDLLDALKSLKGVTAPPACSPPDKNEQQQRSQQWQKDPAQALALVGSTLSDAAGPRLRSTTTTRFKTVMVPVSDFEQGNPQQAAAVESSENLENSDFQIEAQSTECGVIEGFCRDHGIIERLQVTPQEIEALSKVSLLGSLTCRQDALFVLRQVRSAMKPAGLQATVRPESVDVPYQDIEYDSWIAELIRRESLARLNEFDSSGDIDHRNPLHRVVVVSSALVLMAIFMGISIAMC